MELLPGDAPSAAQKHTVIAGQEHHPKHAAIEKLEHQSTWHLLGLSLITYFVYTAYYIRQQTKVINENYDDEGKISGGFTGTIIIVSYISLGCFIAYLFVEEFHPMAKINSAVDRIWSILLLVWGFKARNRMNSILGAKKMSKEWFSGLWTFFFSPFYFNFKVNDLRREIRQGAKIGTEQ